eukprot:431149_1
MTDSDANDISHDIAQRRECLIFGFVRDIQLILPKHWIIPKSIKLECLRYYWQETFIVSGSNITFDIKHNIITNTKTGWHQSSNTTFGEIYFGKASKYVFSWSFKILSCTAYIYIGIDSSKRKHPERSFCNGYDTYYIAYGSNCTLLRNDHSETGMYDYGTNDIVTMTVYAPLGKIEYKIEYSVNEE